ncbi:hypothetical protein PHYSODRAFT_343317 [Phytophthora sojae]|uniref:PNPLA domain-containing protein n=1 Tax=Phytophthora sojae (strain P6497) TaxID=1094619 RepID=G5AJB3_PHYSP|nr:hypothetical protein PHYSODRAFT_343317 [Phytophthora sojae]EGZ04383.1 hypothetical protein PHYSODRAFT_343317 [Phytophthora sojae]|eukprot:XP_009540164.1 hypothetical protein PHYSODRAFT_343317 [Phytophthora sojae]
MDSTTPLVNLPRQGRTEMQSSVFALEFVGRPNAKHRARKERRRIARLRSVLRWRRAERDLLRKLSLQQKRLRLHVDSRQCRPLPATRDTNLHVQQQLEPSPDVTAFEPTEPRNDLLHFFSGGGWLMVYMYGVCKALRELKVDERAKFIGTSAGCLAIVSLVLKSDFDEICDSVVDDYVPAAHASWRGPFRMRDYLIDAVTRHGNANNIHELQGKVTIVYTSLSAWVARRVSRFKNPLHLLQTMVASCCATPLPLFEHGVRTITVTPNVFVPPWWSMYPPSQREMRWLYDLGYEDGLSWCVRQGLPGSESIELPTKAATYRGEWKTVVGQVVGYRSVEDAVLAMAGLLLLSEETVTSTVIRLEILLWRLVAVVAALLEWSTVLWTVLAGATLMGLAMLDQHCTLKFVVVLGAHLIVAVLKLKEACWQVHSSPHWQELRDSLGAMEKQTTTSKVGPTPQQEAMLAKWSYVYRFSSLLV